MITNRIIAGLTALAVFFAVASVNGVARASIAYGSINNFDTVNDTSNVCHGFEIELDDIHSTDITYTYDYNHYGTPKITEDTFSVPGHTNVIVRYEAVWTNTGWSAYTAVPTNNIPPTQGHAFTNPSLNFGGEHFGVGYRNSPTKVYYYWLTNSGSTLVRGPQVNVSTPVFNPGPAPAQVVPVIPAPVLPKLPSLIEPAVTFEFSDATWVKVITTTSHTNSPVALRDLVTPDTNNPSAKDWRHGESAEVETEWQLLQIDFNSTNGTGGANGQLGAKPTSWPEATTWSPIVMSITLTSDPTPIWTRMKPWLKASLQMESMAPEPTPTPWSSANSWARKCPRCRRPRRLD